MTPEKSNLLLLAYRSNHCESAFRELVTAWSGMVYSTALRISQGRSSLAEEVTQKVFTRLAAAPGKVRDGRALGGWLHAAATGFTLDALRSEVRRRKRELISQDLMMAPLGFSDPAESISAQELSAAIDSALNTLSRHDSQLLIMRFWQQQDWRTIGQSFGVSEDTAQKRMTRALDRLRRYLAGQGITRSAAAVSLFLSASVPAELPAAAVRQIFSCALLKSNLPLATIVMSLKTKVALASLLVIAASAPLLYHQKKGGSLENDTLGQYRANLPTHKFASPARGETESDNPSPAVKRDEAQSAADPTSDQSTIGESISGKFDALNRGKIEEKLSVLRHRLSLTPDQEARIARVLEAAQPVLRVSPPNVIITKPTPEQIQNMDRGILAALTPVQQQEFAAFRAEEQANLLEAVANRELSQLQSLTTLSPVQKDQVFAALSEIASQELTLPVLDPGKDGEALDAALQFRWSTRKEALKTILTPEQMALYQQAGNPFPRGGGG